MKNRQMERMHALMQQYHQSNPWLLQDGLFIPNDYPKTRPLTWWSDVGFIVGGRRVLVRWTHPRMAYSEAVEALAFLEAGPFTEVSPFLDGRGRTRRKASHSSTGPADPKSSALTDRLVAYFDGVHAIEDRLRTVGIDHVIRPSMAVRWLPDRIDMKLCVPIEVRDVQDVRKLAYLAKRLMKREVTLADVFPGYEYTRDLWLRDGVSSLGERTRRMNMARLIRGNS